MRPTSILDRINERAAEPKDSPYDTSAKTHIPGVLEALAAGQFPHRIIEAHSGEDRELNKWIEKNFSPNSLPDRLVHCAVRFLGEAA
jgi:hypothetical protein